MTEKEQKKAAKAFAERWKGRGYEKGESNYDRAEIYRQGLTQGYSDEDVSEVDGRKVDVDIEL